MLISVLVSTLCSLHRLNHKAQLQQLHGLISSLLFTMLSVFGVSLSVTDHPELVVHLYDIQIFCFRQTTVKCVVNFQYMHSRLGVKWQTRCQHYLPRERKEQKITNHCLGDSAVSTPFISRKGMSEWDDDSSKQFFWSFLYASWMGFFLFFFTAFASPPTPPTWVLPSGLSLIYTVQTQTVSFAKYRSISSISNHHIQSGIFQACIIYDAFICVWIFFILFFYFFCFPSCNTTDSGP